MQYSTETSLKQLGLKLGDAFALKAFVEKRISQDEKQQENKEERKRKLLDILQRKADNSKPKRTKLSSGKTSAKPKTRRILLGMMNYDAKKKKYTRVSLVKGGGTRKVDLPLDFNKEDVIRYAVKLFLPEVEYTGSTSDVIYELANFKQEPVSDLVDSNNTVHAFTIQKYCELCKTHQFNLYLLVKENREVEDEEGKEDDNDLLIPVFSIPVEEEIPNLSLEASQPDVSSTLQSSADNRSNHASRSLVDLRPERNSNIATRDPLSTCTSTETNLNWNLIGSSCDRLQLREEQQNAFEKSLKADQEAEANKREAAQRQESLESLRSARLSRVPREPEEELNEEKVTISIRHPSMGAVSRNFLRRESMFGVYDWCGSLSLEPEFFGLYTALPSTFISPCEPVTSVAGTMLYVHEQSSPVSMSNDELEVSLRGFGLPRPVPITEGHETIQIEDNDISLWDGFSASPIQEVNLPVEIMDEHFR